MTPEQIASAGTEGAHQSALFCFAQKNLDQYPELEFLFHIPNGDSRGPDKRSAMIVGARLKAQGVKAGIPDMCLPVARQGYHGLFIELKVKRNVPSLLQERWIDILRQQGYRVDVCVGWEAAKESLIWYLTK